MGSCSQIEGEDWRVTFWERLFVWDARICHNTNALSFPTTVRKCSFDIEKQIIEPRRRSRCIIFLCLLLPCRRPCTFKAKSTLTLSSAFFTENDLNFFLQKCKECLFARSSLLLQFFYWSWFHCVTNYAYNAIFWYWKTPLLWIL